MYGHGMMTHALKIIDDAVLEGVDISCDSGMYTSFSTLIGSEAFNEEYFKMWGCGFDKVFMASGKYAGQQITSQEMFRDMRKNCANDAANAMIGCENEILMAFDLPYMMCSSDAGVSSVAGVDGAVHPQDAASFAKFIRESVVTTRRLTLVDAISRITSLPAQRMGFDGKGRLKPGADADIVVFELDKVRERADFPHLGKADAFPEGFHFVIINGKVAVRGDKIECTDAGKVLRSPNVEWKL
jgi:N-acyl-D-amino-acid deacylase